MCVLNQTSCLNLQIIVITRCAGCVTCDKLQIQQVELCNGFRAFARGLATAVSGCRTPGSPERKFRRIVEYQFHGMCFSARALQLYGSN